MVLASIAGVVSGLSSVGFVAIVNSALTTASPSAVLYVGICFVMLMGSLISQFFMIRLSQDTVFDLRLFLIDRILAAHLRCIENIGATRLFPALTEDVQAISRAFQVLPVICINVAIIVGCLIYLGYLSWAQFLLVLGFLVLGALSYHLLHQKAVVSLTSARNEQDILWKHFRSLTGAVKELKLNLKRRRSFLELLKSSSCAFRKHNIHGLGFYACATNLGKFLFFVLIGFVVFVLPNVAEFNAELQTGFLITIIYLMTPLMVLMPLLPELARATVALKKIESLGLSLEKVSEERDLTNSSIYSNWNQIKLMGVTHTYFREHDDSSFMLGPTNLTLHRGELIFLVGGNGSGKTTLAKILTGLYIPEGGDIYLDEQPITDQNREWYRQHFSVIFSDFYLFESLLGMESFDLDSISRDYLVKLQLDHKVKINGTKLSTTALSQGQRKRLALLTAYIENRPIYVFDEWAADQDPNFKNVFYTKIVPDLRAKEKTVIVISHDERYYYLADRIVKLDSGKIHYQR